MSDVAASSEAPESNSLPVSAVWDREANARDVRLLFSHELIDDAGRREALQLLYGPVAWWRWIDRALVFLGLVLVLAGVICLLAWNWDKLHPLIKLGLVAVAILGSCGVAWRRGLHSLMGQAAQLTGAVLAGVFLAILQDDYRLFSERSFFIIWALLILPWVALARFSGLWMFWIGLLNLAVVFWNPRAFDAGSGWVVLGAINGIFVVLREVGWRRGWPWLRGPWTRWLLVLVMLMPLMFLAVDLAIGQGLIFDGRGQIVDRLAAAFLLAVVLPIMGWYFRRSAPDLLSLTCAATCVCLLADLVIGRVLFAELKIDTLAGFLLMGLTVVGTVSGATLWLLKELRRQRSNPKRERVGTIEDGSPPIEPSEPSPSLTLRVTESGSDAPRAPTVGQLLMELQATQRLAAARLEQAATVLVRDSGEETPWFVAVLVGFGAWVACLCFLVCLAIAGAFKNEWTIGALGFLGTALATVVHHTVPRLFARQFALSAGLAGYILVMVALGDGQWKPAAVVSVVLSLVIYPLYPSGVMRFLLTCAPQWMFVIANWPAGLANQQQTANAIHVLVLIQTAGVGAIFAWRPKQILWPAGYALAGGLLATLLTTTIEFRQMAAWPSSVIQASAEIWLIAWLMSAGRRRDPTLMLLAAGACAVIGLLSAPGVLAAVGILLLGHLERDHLLRSLGLLFLPVYLVAFFYEFNTTLLMKSGMLIGSGLMLWLARTFVRRQLAASERPAIEESLA